MRWRRADVADGVGEQRCVELAEFMNEVGGDHRQSSFQCDGKDIRLFQMDMQQVASGRQSTELFSLPACFMREVIGLHRHGVGIGETAHEVAVFVEDFERMS